MPHRRLRFVVLMLAALTLALETAHVLELPQKLDYSAELYTAVNSTMYLYFALVGAPLTILTLLTGAWLAFVLRHQAGFGWTVAGVVLYYLAFAVWLTAVSPVNSTVAVATANDPASLPGLWMALRPRWEFGHAVGFVLELVGLACLVWSVVGAGADDQLTAASTSTSAFT